MSAQIYYIYHDENYPLSWISEKSSRKIVEYFTSKYGFKAINANELRNIMNKALTSPNESVVVFSQDIVPDTVVDNITSPTENSLIKRFLNHGHTIIWIGDLPLFYVGRPNREKTIVSEGYRVFYPRLPNPFEAPDSPIIKSQDINLTYYGSLVGLTYRWDSWRPVPQGWSPIAPPLQRPALYPLAQHYTGSGYRFISYIVDYSGGGLRGLIRLYDCKLADISEEMLEQMGRVILHRNPLGITKMLINIETELRKLKEELETRFKIMKNDIDRTGNYIKEAIDILRAKKE